MIDVGLMLPYMSPTSRTSLFEWIDQAEQGGFSTLSVGDRVSWLNLDQFVLLSAAAARTERVRIATQVTILPIYPAALSAKRIASLDVISGGRVRVGVGVGDREHDYLSVDASMERRYSRLAEDVSEMRSIWRGEPQRSGFDAVGPVPVQAGGPEIWTGGWGPRALARAAQWADGYMGWTPDGSSEDLEASASAVAAAWKRAGREAPPMLTAVYFCLGDRGEQHLRERVGAYFSGGGKSLAPPLERICNLSDPAHCRRALANAEATGYQELTFIPVIDDASQARLLEDAIGL